MEQRKKQDAGVDFPVSQVTFFGRKPKACDCLSTRLKDQRGDNTTWGEFGGEGEKGEFLRDLEWWRWTVIGCGTWDHGPASQCGGWRTGVGKPWPTWLIIEAWEEKRVEKRIGKVSLVEDGKFYRKKGASLWLSWLWCNMLCCVGLLSMVVAGDDPK